MAERVVSTRRAATNLRIRLLPIVSLPRIWEGMAAIGKHLEMLPMATVFNILAIAVMVAVVIVLLRGLVNMMRGGSGNTSNKLMQARVLLQFVALVLILLAVYFTRH